jgi:hypothetical protein
LHRCDLLCRVDHGLILGFPGTGKRLVKRYPDAVHSTAGANTSLKATFIEAVSAWLNFRF